ncbi:MAG: hypothetical protein ACE37J_18570 [Pikeienuella sp.]|uniref:hypothetical protein n=1 Tax=Pikeienuella sp. TaxID=2831957 RepID=UPI003919527C
MKPEMNKNSEPYRADLDYAAVDAAMLHARRLRAEAMAATLIALWRAPGAALDWLRAARPAAAAPRRHAAERIRTALTGLRASAEILRDHPDISAAERRRLVEIVLAEEARLEALTGAGREAGKA